MIENRDSIIAGSRWRTKIFSVFYENWKFIRKIGRT